MTNVKLTNHDFLLSASLLPVTVLSNLNQLRFKFVLNHLQLNFLHIATVMKKKLKVSLSSLYLSEPQQDGKKILSHQVLLFYFCVAITDNQPSFLF